MNKDVVLQADGLHKRFGSSETTVELFNQLQLSVHAAETVAIMGASGSGKSTLLHILSGLERPTQGRVSLLGHSLFALDEAKRGRLRNQALGFVYQFHHLLPELTALENVALPLWIRRLPTRVAEAEARCLLEHVGLAERFSHKPSELSGGERQRVAIARALITQPVCVLADEPTGNLDRLHAQQVFDLLLALNREKKTALLLVTHDSALAQQMQTRYLLEAGQLLRSA